MARLPITPLKQMSEISLTPLIDLSFLLLITFVITFPLVEQGIPIDLPRGKANELAEKKSRTVSIDGQGRLYLDDVAIEIDRLTQAMKDLGASGSDALVMVRADQNIRYREVVRLLKIIQDANVTRMALVTRAEEGP